MSIYTLEQWKRDRVFKADPGQEITEEVYSEMKNCVPPKDLPADKAEQALQSYKIPVHDGFLMGEAADSDKDGPLFHAFGLNDFGKGKHFYYLGLSHQLKEMPDGIYYFLDGMNALPNGGMIPANKFRDEAEAIQTAADTESTLYRYEYRNGQRIDSKVLHEPQFV